MKLTSLHPAVRFLIVGGTFAAIYAVVTALLVRWTTVQPALLSALVYLGCIPPAYWCQSRFTFRPQNPRRHPLSLYALTQFLALAIVTTISAVLTTEVLVWNTVAYLCASAIAAVVSYIINRFVVFPG